jgi:cation diffusion facilitator family transporter
MPVLIFFGKVILSVLLLMVGLSTRSKGLVADAIHSVSDVFAAFVVLIGFKISNREETPAHPWGHGKVEFVLSLILYTVLIGLSVFIFVDALEAVLGAGTRRPPHMLAALGGLIEIVASFIFAYYGLCAGKKANSALMISFARENRMDILTGIVVVAGVLGANFGYVFLDALAAMIVAIVIFCSWGALWLQALNNLLDQSLSPRKIKLIKDLVLSFREVKDIRFMKTRLIGQSIWVDIEILVNAKLSVQKGYAVAREIRLALVRRFRHIKDVTVTYTCEETPFSPKLAQFEERGRLVPAAG